MSWSGWRRVRQVVQWVSMAAYVYLLFATLQRRSVLPLADAFFRLDPLVAISAMLAGQAWIARLVPAFLVIGLTLLLGRAWCGWLCPMGTVLDLFRFRRARVGRALGGGDSSLRARVAAADHWLRRVKYLFLFLILSAALFGNLTLLLLDPITILTRTMTTAILPTSNRLVTGAESALYDLRPLRGVISGLERLIRGPVLPVEQSVFHGSALFGVLFVGLVALNLLADRFWCRYLCPLGGFLGLLSKVAVVRRRISATCNNCAVCAGTCSLEAIHPEEGYESDPTECTVCLDCFAACPQSGIELRAHRGVAPSQPYDPSRRQFLSALGGATLGAMLLNGEAARALPHPRLVRPPGSDDEGRFLSLCARCSQCMKVCPTAGLQPAMDEAGLQGIGTPRLVPRLGYCDYSCNACGQVCPTGAIPGLDLAAKRNTIIGKAYIDEGRCLPWADGIPCIVCEEMCPIPDKAVRLTEETAVDPVGNEIVLQMPHVLRDLCIGCGICEYQCPLEGESAIRVRRS